MNHSYLIAAMAQPGTAQDWKSCSPPGVSRFKSGSRRFLFFSDKLILRITQ